MGYDIITEHAIIIITSLFLIGLIFSIFSDLHAINMLKKNRQSSKSKLEIEFKGAIKNFEDVQSALEYFNKESKVNVELKQCDLDDEIATLMIVRT